MIRTEVLRHGVPWAGIWTGPAAWTVSTQLNYVLVPVSCARAIQPVPWVALVLALIALSGGWLSYKAWVERQGGPSVASSVRAPRKLLAGLGVLMAGLFALVIVLQGAAGFFLMGCER